MIRSRASVGVLRRGSGGNLRAQVRGVYGAYHATFLAIKLRCRSDGIRRRQGMQ